VVCAGDSDHVRLAEEPTQQLHDAKADHGIDQHWKDGDHEDRAPVAQLIAQLPQPDETDDRPAHAFHPDRRHDDSIESV
jgi:hypothetical protein